ncbi:MAG: kinase-like domain-containing protein [Monoraphidium minutum]|nr:MAG: kinase-like domain-containing protein [Monoraphidium minutum]
MYKRATEQDAMMDAVEMAVLSAACHPHVVRSYACLTDMVAEAGDAPASASIAVQQRPAPPRYRRLLPFEDPEGVDTSSIIVMEYCDLGTLRRAAQRGLFHRALGTGPRPTLGVDLAALVEVALEVAQAAAYLHSIRLLHCDIKLDNVLLKSEVSQPRGYISKLADFGLAKVLGAAGAATNVACAGTVTHLAPELFVPGSRVTPAADAYAFGVLLYELYAGGASAYAGLPKAAIIDRVARAGLRPRFPEGAPRGYVAVAAACWAPDPAARPGFPAIIAALEALRLEVERSAPHAACAP